MTGDVLYIDGVAVDLGEKVEITLNYKNNLLTDLSKIVGNSSYTVKLPKTLRNLGIIGGADNPSGITRFMRSVHECRYFRNGVEVIADGRAVVLGVNDAIEVVMMWGSASALRRLVDDGKNLNDLVGSADYVDWTVDVSASAYNGTDKVLYADMHIGLSSASEYAVLHPCVRSTYIFDRLKAVYGLTVEVDERRRALVESLIVPLLTRRGGEVNEEESRIEMTHRGSAGGWMITGNGSKSRDYFKVNEFDFDDDWGNNKVQGIFAETDMHVRIVPNIRASVSGLMVRYGTSGELGSYIYLPYHKEGVWYVYDTAVEIDIVEGDGFILDDSILIAEGSTAVVTSAPDSVKVGGKFPIVENLPEMKSVDFLKAVAAVSGTFAVVSGDGGLLRFVPYDVLNERENALDWTDKVVSGDWNPRPKEMVYALDDYARYNRLKWKDDDSVGVSDEGVIKVDDMTLDYERDAVTLPFAATDTVDDRAMIWLYEYNEDGEPEIQSVSPRLLLEKDVNGIATATFNDLRWWNVIAEYYGAFTGAVREPVVITERIRLNEYDLRGLDMSRAVYLGQYGRFFAVVEVKAPSGGVCDCKLLRLDL